MGRKKKEETEEKKEKKLKKEAKKKAKKEALENLEVTEAVIDDSVDKDIKDIGLDKDIYDEVAEEVEIIKAGGKVKKVKAKKATLGEFNLRVLIRNYDSWQKLRIAIANRLKIKKDGTNQKIPESQLESWKMPDVHKDEFRRQWAVCHYNEKLCAKWIKDIVQEHPLYKRYLINIRGIGPTFAAYIIAEYDINLSATSSVMWKRAGMAPGFDKRVAGVKICYNAFLKKKLLGVIANFFIKMNTIYADHYYNYKKRWENKMIVYKEGEEAKPVYPAHRNAAAKRYMMKMFIKDLYFAWRTIAGLEIVETWAIRKGGIIHHGPEVTNYKMFLDSPEKEKKRPPRPKDKDAEMNDVPEGLDEEGLD
jgi:hypothetical protein